MYTLQVQVAGRVDEIPVTKGDLSLGRYLDNDVILDDPQVSGRHARRLRRSRTGKFKCV
jgi:pSer/pThr/pTyr-binding forkhead associated (FHA) protein